MNSFSQVLLIDDNPVQLKIREAVLRNAGFHVCVATTADSAMAMLHTLKDRIGVVVTDHVMPVVSGSDFVRRLRGEQNWVPVIVLSGMAEAFTEYEGLEVVFRAKPLPPLELIELVHRSFSEPADHLGAA